MRPPLDKGGLQGGLNVGIVPTPALRATPPTEGIFKCHSHDLLTASFDAASPYTLYFLNTSSLSCTPSPGPVGTATSPC